MGAHPAPWEADYELLPCEGLFHEYLEMGKIHNTATLPLADPEMQCVIEKWGAQGALGVWRRDGVAAEPGGGGEVGGGGWGCLGAEAVY